MPLVFHNDQSIVIDHEHLVIHLRFTHDQSQAYNGANPEQGQQDDAQNEGLLSNSRDPLTVGDGPNMTTHLDSVGLLK
jgi:hypothetical protein